MNTIEMNQTFIVAAYVLTWVVLIAYAARLVRKGSRTRAAYEQVLRDNSGDGGQ